MRGGTVDMLPRESAARTLVRRLGGVGLPFQLGSDIIAALAEGDFHDVRTCRCRHRCQLRQVFVGAARLARQTISEASSIDLSPPLLLVRVAVHCWHTTVCSRCAA